MTNSPTNLQQLILNNKRDRTYEQLAKDADGLATKSNIQRLATQPIKDMPTTAVLKGLARALRVRLTDVVQAAAVSAGLNPSGTRDHDLVIIGAGDLPAESQQILISTAENMLWWQEQAGITSDHGDSSSAEVRELFPVRRAAADKGEHGIDPEQLPED